MRRKVKLKTLPKMAHGGTQNFGPQTPPVDATASPTSGSYLAGSDPEIKVKFTLEPTTKENATLEAELGETVLTNLQGEGIPEFFKIGGKRHYNGGTPLNLPPNSFIFSRDNKLAIKDKEILDMFGKRTKGSKGFTPADISKNFNINKYREILANPYSDKRERDTAEMMIKNYNLKLGSLALVQESMKGFDNGIPAVAVPYMDHVGISPEDLLGTMAPPAQEGLQAFKGGGEKKKSAVPGYKYGGAKKRKIKVTSLPTYQEGRAVDLNIPITERGDTTSYGFTGHERGNVMAGAGVDFGKLGINAFGMTPASKESRGYWPGMFSAGANYDVGKRMNLSGELGVGPGTVTPKVGMKMFFEDGGAPQTSARPTYDLPEDAVVWDPAKENYDDASVKKGHYILEDGKLKKVTGFKAPAYEGDFEDDRLGNFQDSYGLLEDKFRDEDFRKAFVDNYKKEIAAAKPNSRTGLTQADIDAAKAMEPSEIISTFLHKQKVNFAINTKYGDMSAYDKRELWDHNPNLANETAEGLGYNPLNKAQVAAFQAGYIGLNKMSKDPKQKKLIKDFSLFQVGEADETIKGFEGEGTISKVDGWDGNTTSGEVAVSKDSERVLEDMKAVEKAVQEEPEHLPTPATPYPAKFWTPDLMNIAGDFSDLYGIKKHMPWQGTPQFFEATPSFTDFRGTAARIQAGTKGLADAAGIQAPPQARGAIYANLQKGMVDPILKAQEAEARTNIGIANQFAATNAQAKTQFSGVKAGLATQLWDKTAMANQQFDNAKRQAKEALRQSMINAWTNRGKTQAMNAMREDFKVDPTTGFVHHVDSGRKITPSQDQRTAYYDEITTLKSRFPNATLSDLDKMYRTANKMPFASNYAAGVDPNLVNPYGQTAKTGKA